MLAHLKEMLKFEPGAFLRIAADPASTKQALLVVAAASAIGSWPISVWSLLWVLDVFVFAGLCCLLGPLLSGQAQPYSVWFRALGFAEAPSALVAVPILGSFVGGIYCMALQLVAIRELSKFSAVRTVIVWILACILGTAPSFVFVALHYLWPDSLKWMTPEDLATLFGVP